MKTQAVTRTTEASGGLYGPEYYEHGCGPVPYERSEVWLDFFGKIAEESIRALNPRRVFDAGCAMGFLVEAFWDRGVFCEGIDISEYAISRVRRDMVPYCKVGSIAEPIPGRYDLATCIEVLEHITPADAALAVKNLCAAADAILFSSTSSDTTEPTHFNVQPTIYWLNLFFAEGFLPDASFDASFLASHAMLLRRASLSEQDFLRLFSEYLRYKCSLQGRGATIRELQGQTQELQRQAQELRAQIQAIRDSSERSLADERAMRERDHERHRIALERGLESGRIRAAEAQLALARFREEAEKRVIAAQASARAQAEAAAERGAADLSGRISAAEARLRMSLRKTDLAIQEKAELRSHVRILRNELTRMRSEKLAAVPALRSFLGSATRPFRRRVRQLRNGRNRQVYLESFEQDLQLIQESKLFDSDWYLDQYPDVAVAGISAFEHYLRSGGAEGRNPGPQFDGHWYLQQYPDVLMAGANPLIHYLKSGLQEGRQIQSVESRVTELDSEESLEASAELIRCCSLFDSKWYIVQNPDLAALDMDAAHHYLRYGGLEGRNPSARFDSNWYLGVYSDVKAAGWNPLLHYIEYGSLEGREIRRAGDIHANASPGSIPDEAQLRQHVKLIAGSSFFDPVWYCAQYPDVAVAKMEPAYHYLRFGAAEGRNPGPEFDGAWYLKRNPDVTNAGLNPLVHYLQYGIKENRLIRAPRPNSDGASEISGPSAKDLLEERFRPLTPLPVFSIPNRKRRLNLVTDSISKGSVYGGVGTSLILSALVAQRAGASVRLITRNDAPAISNLDDVLSANGISWTGETEFIYSPQPAFRNLDVSENDFFLTTSWWTTVCTRKAVPAAKIAYLLQEDERMFYPFGDYRLRCEEVLSASDLRFIINSKLLFDHFVSGDEPLPNIAESGTWFEPAFPDSHYFPEFHNRKDQKSNFFFYARPKNRRNLFWRGLEILNEQIEEGMLSPEEWNFYFVGCDVNKMTLPRNASPIIFENLPWEEYAALVRQMDLGLCLIDTPHPSYPVLDLAASGAVVVTNRRGLKKSLSQYSENILCADSDVKGLKKGLAEGAGLARDQNTRVANYNRNGMCRSWETALANTVEYVIDLMAKNEA